MPETERSIGRLMLDALRKRRRARIAQRFFSGKWGVELETFEADQERDRQQGQEIALRLQRLNRPA